MTDEVWQDEELDVWQDTLTDVWQDVAVEGTEIVVAERHSGLLLGVYP